MERAPLSIGQRLEKARLDQGWTQGHVARQIGVEPATVGRWERDENKPQAFYHQKLCALFGKSKQDLGLCEEENEQPMGEQTHLVIPVVTPVSDASAAFRTTNLTTRLEGLVWSWLLRKNATARQELPVALMLEWERKDNTTMQEDDALSRRDALRHLASIPIQFCGLSPLVSVFSRPMEEILTLCTAGITACWELRKGKDLAFAFDTISWYLPTLKAIAATGTTVQKKEASELLAQGFILQASLAKHVTNISDGIRYALEAATYGEASANPLLHIRALGAQDSVFSYLNQWEQALHTARQAKDVMDKAIKRDKSSVPLVAQSYVYAHLASYQAYMGQKQEALESLGKAHSTFFAQSINKSLPVYTDHSQDNLILYDGLTHAHLGLHKEAFDSFQQIHALDKKSEIVRVEALIHQAKAEVSREDKEPNMDLCIALWRQGIEGAKALGSLQRFNEAIITYTAMSVAWRKEKAIKELRSSIVWPEKKSRND